VAVSLAGHAAVIAAIEVFDLLAIDGGGGPAADHQDQDEVAVTPSFAPDSSCAAEATLAAAARTAVCASPMGGRDCRAGLERAWRRDLDACRMKAVADRDQPRRVEVALLDDAALARIKPMPILPLLPEEQQKFEEEQQQKLEEKVAEARREESQPAPNAQVIEVTQPDVEATPDKARYVSEYDTRVDKQTVARGSTEEMVARPKPRDLPVASQDKLGLQKPTEPLKPSPFENPRGTGALDMRRPGPTEAPAQPVTELGATHGVKEPTTAEGVLQRSGQGQRISTRTTTPQGDGGTGGEVGRPKVPDLRPSEEVLSRVVGGGSVDDVDDADDGETTALNSKRWKFATFFNRMKRQVAQNWHPDRVYLQRDPNGNVYGTRDRITVLRVTLKPDGSLAKTYVVQSCGVDFLDDEAVHAFQLAQPFPNPPSALVQGDQITFSFGFHFQIGGPRERWRIFRYQ